jgi:hypothetical protein
MSAEDFEVFKIVRDEERDKRREQNWKVLNECNIPFKITNDDECCLFREPGMPKVDFYPSSGRWRVANSKASGGGAVAFLNWYAKQRKGPK